MKKNIYIALACIATGLSLQSCLHDDKDFFDDSAANRIESTVENTKTILESAANGWQLHYFTGENYGGGGYTFLLKFQNGKVTVAGDSQLATSSERATSSFGVDRSMGPVITFNTYNSILHQLGTPTYSDIQGQQGDWEFVVTKLTEDSVFVRGKKWGNNMVFTRLPENIDWTARLDSIADVDEKLQVNYNAGDADDASKAIEVNNTARRILSRSADNKVMEQPFYVTTTGIKSLNPVTVSGTEVTEFDVDDNGTLTAKNATEVKLAPYVVGIDTWIGSWTLSSMSGGCDMIISKVEDAENTLEGQFTISGNTYSIGLTFDPQTGKVNMPNQLIEDGSGKYPALWLINADLDQGMLLGEGGMNLVWHGVGQQAEFEDDGTLAAEGYTTDTFCALACDTDGNLIKENNSYVFVFSWYYLSNMTKN